MAERDLTNVHGLTPDLDEALQRAEESLAGLRGGPGGPYDGDMESRVAKLDALLNVARGDVAELRGDMKDVRDRLSRLEVKVDHLPTKGFFLAGLASLLAAIAALIAFAEKIQAFFA